MSSITDFYRDEHILITGGTGFVGRLLISKLLLSCPDIKKIMLLVRINKNETIEDKFHRMFSSVIFKKLKNEMPTFYEKIELIEGDCEQQQLGLSLTNKMKIIKHATVVFHCAANVEFDNNLRKEINMNVFGTIEIINLARNIQNLKVFVYVSSSYSNCHNPIVEEKYYKPSIHYKTLMKLMNLKHLALNDTYILGNIENTYFYTKAASEQVVIEEGKDLPIAIFRPSAIISTWKEPIPGWTDKAFAPTAFVKAFILGYFASIHCSNNLIIDMVPGDLTVNALIAVAWDIHKRHSVRKLSEPRIYNYVSMTDNLLTFKSFLNKISVLMYKKPSEHGIWYPKISMYETRFRNKIASFIRPQLLVFIAKLWAYILGNRKLMKRYSKVCEMYNALMKLVDYFARRPHIYFNDNIRELWNNLSEEDKTLFLFDLKKIDWDSYLNVYYNGIKLFLIREENLNEQKARKHFMKLQVIHTALMISLNICGLFIVCWLLYTIFL